MVETRPGIRPNAYQHWLATTYSKKKPRCLTDYLHINSLNFRPGKVGEALEYITNFAEGTPVSAAIAKNRLTAAMIKMAPGRAIKGMGTKKNLIIEHLSIMYSPGIGEVIQEADEVEQCEDPRLNPKIFRLDKQRLGFIYQVDMKNLPPSEEEMSRESIVARRENEFINEATNQILHHVRAQYEHYTGGKWNALSDNEQKQFLQEMVIVGSDNGRVLGIGDWGKNAGITAGKNLCYFAGANGAFAPEQLMGIGFDVGTDNVGKNGKKSLAERHCYKGIRNGRERGEEYYQFMHLMLRAIDKAGIGTFQFEDFQGEQAWKLLDWSRQNLEHTVVFNDDIEGTAAMAMNVLYVAKHRGVDLTDSLFVIEGVGGAGSGITKQTLNKLRRDMREAGIPEELINEKIKKQLIFKDRYGLLYEGQIHSAFTPFQKNMHLKLEDETTLRDLKEYMIEKKSVEETEEAGDPQDFTSEICERLEIKKKRNEERVNRGLPIIENWQWGDEIEVEEYMEFLQKKQGDGEKLLGKDGNGSVFVIATTTKAAGMSTKLLKQVNEIIKSEAPDKDAYILGLSNPTQFTDFLTEDESERFVAPGAKKEDRDAILTGAITRVYEIFNGNVRIATGTRFPDVKIGQENIIIGQGNNVFIFPGVGLGLSLAGISMRDLTSQDVTADALWDELWLTATETLFDWYANDPDQTKRLQAGVLMPEPSDIPKVTLAIAKKIAEKIRGLANRYTIDVEHSYNRRVRVLMNRREPPEQEVVRAAIALTEGMIEHVEHIHQTRPYIGKGDEEPL